MPHPHPRPHRRPAMAGSAAVLALLAAALTACSSSTTSTQASTQANAAAAGVTQLTGAGSTFDAPFFTSAFAAYQQAHPAVAINYAAVGSSAGITRFTAGQVNFGA